MDNTGAFLKSSVEHEFLKFFYPDDYGKMTKGYIHCSSMRIMNEAIKTGKFTIKHDGNKWNIDYKKEKIPKMMDYY